MLTLFLLFRALFGFETDWSIRNARISQLKIIASLPCVLLSHGAQVAFCDGMVNQLTVAMNEWMGKWRAEGGNGRFLWSRQHNRAFLCHGKFNFQFQLFLVKLASSVDLPAK